LLGAIFFPRLFPCGGRARHNGYFYHGLESRLLSRGGFRDDGRMTSKFKSSGPVTLSDEQILALLQKFSDMRHDVVGRLSNITAAAELIRVRPENIEERLRILLDQPHQAAERINKFTRELESVLGVVRQ
jgi:hypothetical protein